MCMRLLTCVGRARQREWSCMTTFPPSSGFERTLCAEGIALLTGAERRPCAQSIRSAHVTETIGMLSGDCVKVCSKSLCSRMWSQLLRQQLRCCRRGCGDRGARRGRGAAHRSRGGIDAAAAVHAVRGAAWPGTRGGSERVRTTAVPVLLVNDLQSPELARLG
jgi:hypothetical protein